MSLVNITKLNDSFRGGVSTLVVGIFHPPECGLPRLSLNHSLNLVRPRGKTVSICGFIRTFKLNSEIGLLGFYFILIAYLKFFMEFLKIWILFLDKFFLTFESY